MPSSLGLAEIRSLVDPRLSARLGVPSPPLRQAILAIVGEAVVSVLGPEVARAISPATDRRLYVLAPWAWDLSRGLHYRGQCGPGEPRSLELVARFADSPVAPDLAERVARAIDLAVTLTMDQTVDHVLGPRAMRADRLGDHDTPWLESCLLGARLRIVFETLRLTNLL